MREKNLSIRDAAKEIGCSPATLTRLLQGPDSSNMPSSITIQRAVSWLGYLLSDFEHGKSVEKSGLAEVEVHLRAVPEFNDTDVETIIAMVRGLHELRTQTKKNR